MSLNEIQGYSAIANDLETKSEDSSFSATQNFQSDFFLERKQTFLFLARSENVNKPWKWWLRISITN